MTVIDCDTEMFCFKMYYFESKMQILQLKVHILYLFY